jgi:hypothetical protein
LPGNRSDNPGRLLLDIDYVLQWVAPEPPTTTLSFWISPATLVFDPAWDLTTDIDRTGWGFQLFLNAITRSDPDERGNYDWALEGDGITISLGAPGFTQYPFLAHALQYGPAPEPHRSHCSHQRRACLVGVAPH